MKLQISAGAVRAFVPLAIIARVICGTIVDTPELQNAGWIAVLLGAVLALPPAIAVSLYRKSAIVPSKPICNAFMIISICDAAAVSSSIADSASYMALNSTPAVYLMLPQLALCLFCLRLNGDSLGASAGIWSKILPWLLLAVVLLQVKEYQPEWLTPVLGPGVPEILSGAIRAAGWFTLPTALYMIAEPGIGSEPADPAPVKTLGICAVFSVFICMIASMTTPVIIDEKLFTRAFRLDSLLANGRTGLAQQLPTITLWYLGLFYALLFDIFTAAALLQRIFPKWNRRACVWIPLITVGILGANTFSGRTASLRLADRLYLLQALLLSLSMAIPLFSRKAGDIHA